ncbi:hypothetical protein N9T65_00580 [Candidatus Pelagibacter sp.]|nr:hypothetical protein [Candidatus Pelagibacter sp.]MDA9186576.1 hypothetical protein [Candidatus Pelagibacter sp.]MDA9663356.1 hypothetical protein [Candidatus Pelagibacter sp.]
MSRKTNTALIALLGTILLGLSTWVLISIIELKSQISFIQSELVNLDKTIGRIFYWFEKFTN